MSNHHILVTGIVGNTVWGANHVMVHIRVDQAHLVKQGDTIATTDHYGIHHVTAITRPVVTMVNVPLA